MGYAGYYSTTSKIKDNRSDLENDLHRISSFESLEVLEKLSYNTAVMPTEDKYRKIKLTNNKIKNTIADVPEAKSALLRMGWEHDKCETDGSDVLRLPKAKSVTMKEVRFIQDAKEAFVKKQKDLKRSASAAGIENDAKAALRAQLDADRRERAQIEPVTKASKAQALPNNGSANITTAGDLGLNSGGCC